MQSVIKYVAYVFLKSDRILPVTGLTYFRDFPGVQEGEIGGTWWDIKAATHILGEVLLDDLVGELVDLDVLMVLQTLDFIQTSTLFYHSSNSFNL